MAFPARDRPGCVSPGRKVSPSPVWPQSCEDGERPRTAAGGALACRPSARLARISKSTATFEPGCCNDSWNPRRRIRPARADITRRASRTDSRPLANDLHHRQPPTNSASTRKTDHTSPLTCDFKLAEAHSRPPPGPADGWNEHSRPVTGPRASRSVNTACPLGRATPTGVFGLRAVDQSSMPSAVSGRHSGQAGTPSARARRAASAVAGLQRLRVSQHSPVWTRTAGRPVPIPCSISHSGGGAGHRSACAAISCSSVAIQSRVR